jgi:hypothetical protein
MTTDRRELVLARCEVLIGQVPGIKLAERNRGEVTGKRRPAIIMHDGAEEVVEADSTHEGGARNSQVQRMRMEPQFLIRLSGEAEDVGPEANALRSALLKTLFSDDVLLDLLGVENSRSTRIAYLGGGLTTEEGEQRECTMEVNLALTYVFRLVDLLV